MRSTLSALLLVLMLSSPAIAMIEIGGPGPVTDQNWPAGCLDVCNHKSRVLWYDHEGECVFLYRGGTGTLDEVLARFAQVKAPDLLVVVHDGLLDSWLLNSHGKDKADRSVDWSFTLHNPENFYRGFRAMMSPRPGVEIPPPRLDVYVSEGRVDWDAARKPEGLRVVDERAVAHGYKPEDGSVIAGVAYDMTTSKPVAAVEVVVMKRVQPPADQPADAETRWETIASAVGDADGRFEVKQIPEGSYAVELRCVGYAPRELEWTDFAKHTFKSYTLRLSPAVDLTGKVVDGSGKPLAGVKVRLDQPTAIDGRYYPHPGRETTTDADGKFTLPGIPRGEASLAANVNGHQQVDPFKRHPIPSPSLTIRMATTGVIHVKVTRGNGEPYNQGAIHIWPVGGLKIGSWGGSADLRDDGTFTFENVPAGKYLASTEPGAPATDDARGTALEVKAGQTVEVKLTR